MRSARREIKRELGRGMVNGQPWLDTSHRPINAHGAWIMCHDSVYYWYGEDRSGPTRPSPACEYRTDVVGINCYSSFDLVSWEYHGRVLRAADGADNGDLAPSRVVERPRVLFNSTAR